MPLLGKIIILFIYFCGAIPNTTTKDSTSSSDILHRSIYIYIYIKYRQSSSRVFFVFCFLLCVFIYIWGGRERGVVVVVVVVAPPPKNHIREKQTGTCTLCVFWFLVWFCVFFSSRPLIQCAHYTLSLLEV